MATNKTFNFFCRFRDGGNRGVLAAGAVLVVMGATLFTSTAFASHPCVLEVSNPNDAHPCEQVEGSLPSNNGNSFGGGTITTLDGLLNRIGAVLNTLVPFLVGLGVFVIIYGVFGYIQHSADEEKRREAKLFVVWGVVGVFIMVSIWGFVSILVNTFPLKRSAPKVESVFPGAN